MPTLALHIKTKDKGFQLGSKCIVLTYIESGDRGTVTRSLRNRSVDYPFLISRACTHEEMRTESHPHRIDFICYNDWDKLINDEKKWTEDAEWISSITGLKQQYPQFSTHGQIELTIPK